MRNKLKRFFYLFFGGILCVIPLCSFVPLSLATAPVASNVLNFLIQNISGRSQILPLIGSDADGTVASFKILSLPNTIAGNLYLNNTPVTLNQVLTPTQAKQLQFEVKSSFTTGNAAFTYTATDNDGLVSSPATFTIPVTNNGSLLVCTGGGLGTNILGASGTFSAPYITANPTVNCINNGSTIASPLGNLGNAVSGLTTYNYASTSNSLGPEGTYSFLKTLGTMAVRNCIKTDWVASDHTGDGGYAMIVNGSPNSNSFGKTFYQASSMAVCPNTLYEFSAYVINILPGNHTAATPGSEPNISFYINNQLVSTSGAIAYANASTSYIPQWVKVGGLWYSGPNTSVNLRIDNATFVAGGNDLGLDDISLAICGPEITYPNISLTPQFCSYGVLPLNAQVKASINTYSSYIFQLSTNGGSTWTDMGTAKTGSPVYDALTNSYVYTAQYGDIPIDPSMNGYRYRLKVATDAPNLTGNSCNVSADKVITVSAFSKPVGGVDIVSCNAISTASLAAAQSGETWSASATNPAAAAITQAGEVSGLSVNGIYEFYLTNTAGCIDTVKVTRSEVKTAGSDAVTCSDQTSYKFADAPAGYEWQIVSGNPSAASIDPSTGYISNLGVNGDYQFQLVSKIAPCADIVKLTKGICPKINFRTGTSSFSENAGTVNVEVFLDQASTLAVSVPYTLGTGTAILNADFTTTTGTLNFNAGETSKMIAVSLVNDSVIEPDETVVLNLATPVNATLGTVSQHILTIQNDDAGICITPDNSVRNEGNPGAVTSTPYTFRVTRSAGSYMANAINFTYQLSSSLPGGFNGFDLVDGSDLNKLINASIPAGQNSVTLTYSIKPDLMIESDDPFKVTITASDAGISIDCPEAEGTVLNDDLNKTIIQFEKVSTQIQEAAVDILLKVILSAPAPMDVDVPFDLTDISTTNDVDYTNIPLASRTIHFNAGDEEAFITISVKEDAADEPDESMQVTLTYPGSTQFILGSQITHTVTITDDDPLIVQDDHFNINEDTALSNTVVTNDYDPGGDPITFTKLADPQHGQVQLNTDGTFTYTPAQDYSGSDSFTYRGCNINNMPSCGTATVYITVIPVNEPPVAGDDLFTGTEDAVITGTVIANDSDPDGDTLTYTRLTTPGDGTVAFSSNGDFTYTPNTNFNGTDKFSYRTCDLSGFCDIAEVILTISPLNDPPKATNDSFSGTEDIAITGTVALNDSDPEGNTLTFTRLTDPSHGTLSFNADGTFTYMPAPDFNGIDKFTYQTCDTFGACDQAEVILNVNPVNDPPFALADTYQTAEDVPLNIQAAGILINDSDPEGDPIIPILQDKTTKGNIFVNQDGSFTYNPDLNATGQDQFTYLVNDGSLNSNVVVVNITIAAENDTPIALDDNFNTTEDAAVTGTVSTNDSDPENDVLTFTKLTDPQHGALVFNTDGTFIYTPAPNFNGTDKFTYKVCDPSDSCDQAEVVLNISSLNDPPVALDDTFTTTEEAAVTGMVSTNDSDPENDVLTFIKLTDPLHGTLVFNTDGTFIYTPDQNAAGQDSFTYSANDGSLNSNAALVSITVTAVNDPPVALDDTFSTTEDIAVTGTVSTNDSDPENDVLTFTKLTDPQHGALVFNTDGTFTYTPAPNFNGTDKFTYKVCDPSDSCDQAEMVLNISPLNDSPVSLDDTFTTTEDAAVAGTVSTNDSDPENDVLTFTKLTDPLHGTLIFNTDGTFIYTPAPNFNGTDKFTYKVCDPSGACDQAEVNFYISPVNDPPVALADNYQTSEDTPLTIQIPGILINDSDPDGDPITPALKDKTTRGSISINQDGSFTYNPNRNATGQDHFNYLVNDGLLNSNIAVVTIDIISENDPPVALDDNFNATEDVVLAGTVASNDSDPENDILTFTKLTDPLHGSIMFKSDGSFTFEPEKDYSGTDKFTYKTCDPSGACAQAQVNFVISPLNDPPVALDDNFNTAEDVSIAGTVSLNDSDPENDALAFAKLSDPLHGSVVFKTDGTFIYTPEKDYTGSDKFTYKVCDPSGTCAQAQVSFVISPVNDPPLAVFDTYQTAEDVPLTIAAPGILINDSDPDGDKITPVLKDKTAKGDLAFNQGGSFTYNPNKNATGQDHFTYLVNDGLLNSNLAVVTINITSDNDPPLAADDDFKTPEDVAITAAVSLNDSDPENDPLTFTLVSNPAHGNMVLKTDGNFSYTPEKNYTGSDKFTYKACDPSGACDMAEVVLLIDPQNDPPIAVNDSFTTAEDISVTGYVSLNDSDPDGDPLTFTPVSKPAHGTVILKADGSFTYTADKNFTGSDKFTYKTCDPSGACAQAEVTLVIDPQNDPPLAIDDNFKTAEDASLAGTIAINDSDPEGDPLTFTLLSNPTHGKIVFREDGSFAYTADNNYTGTDKFTYKACDPSGGCAQANAMIVIDPLNDAPVAVNDTYQTPIGAPLVVKSTGILANDSDPDGDKITAILQSAPSHGKLTLNADGSFVYTPEKTFQGEESFTYLANDGRLNSNVAKVIINIPGNSASALTAIVSLTPARSQVAEGEGSVAITAELSNELLVDVVITLGFGGTAANILDAEDYHLTGDFVSMRIPAGQTKTTQKFEVEALPDALKEGDEYLDARIVSTSTADALIGSGAQVLIKDIYPPVAVVKRELPPNTDILPDPYFSPNNDGNGNEEFTILNIELYPENEVAIFNRWGNEVFRTKGYDNESNAFKGKANRGLLTNTSVDLVDGVYYYMIYSMTGQERRLNKGYVILKR